MLDTINGNSAKALAAGNAYFSGRGAGGRLTTAHTALSLTASERTVTLSISHDAISALISSCSFSASLDSSSSGANGGAPLNPILAEAQQQAQRGKDALSSMKAARKQAAGFTKDFLRQKLEGYKKQLELLRMLGSDPAKIAKDALRIAKGVADAAHDYAAASNTGGTDITDAIATPAVSGGDIPATTSTADSGSAPATDTGTAALDAAVSDAVSTLNTADPAAAGTAAASGESQASAQQDLSAVKAAAAAAPLDGPAGDNPANAPANPDDRFFFEAYRILNLARKTLKEAHQAEQVMAAIAPAAGHHRTAADRKKEDREMDKDETTVDKAYLEMKAGQDQSGTTGAAATSTSLDVSTTEVAVSVDAASGGDTATVSISTASVNLSVNTMV